MKDVTDSNVMLDLQGDRVVAILGKQTLMLTIVRIVVETGSQLLLVSDRYKKYRREWPLLQPLADRLEPNNQLDVRWRLNLDAYPVR